MARPMEDQWTCHVCGQKRPSSAISVQKNLRVMPGTDHEVEENVRYCNDKAECAAAAPNVTFIGTHKPVTATRNSRPVGE
jgi:hypothetical protein